MEIEEKMDIPSELYDTIYRIAERHGISWETAAAVAMYVGTRNPMMSEAIEAYHRWEAEAYRREWEGWARWLDVVFCKTKEVNDDRLAESREDQ